MPRGKIQVKNRPLVVPNMFLAGIDQEMVVNSVRTKSISKNGKNVKSKSKEPLPDNGKIKLTL